VEWSGVEWSGVEWSGVEWSGVEWGMRGEFSKGKKERKEKRKWQHKKLTCTSVRSVRLSAICFQFLAPFWATARRRVLSCGGGK